MKKANIEIGGRYVVKVSGKLTTVVIVKESLYGGWDGRNVATGRDVRIKTAARLRRVAGVKEVASVTSFNCSPVE